MEIITHVLDDYVDIDDNSFIFDIETTGLSSKFCKVILIGVIFNKDNKTTLKQFFANSLDDEKDLLMSFIREISSFNNHITFNGINFDIPFLNARFQKHNIDFELKKEIDFDVYRFIKPYKHRLSLSDCKLKTIEKYMGINRSDTISGKQSVELYNNYLKSYDKYSKEKILLHNYEDVYYLGIISKIKNKLIDTPYNISIQYELNKFDIISNAYKINNLKLTTKYDLLSGFLPQISIYNDNYNIYSKDKNLYIDINIKNGYDSNENLILFYRMSKLIPLKINKDYLSENIYSLSDYLVKKELIQLFN